MAWLQQRENGVWYIHWRDERGIKRAKSLEVRQLTEKQKQRALASFTAEKQFQTQTQKKLDPTPEQFWKAYWPYAVTHKSPNSLSMEEYTWRQFLAEFNPRTMGAVTRQQIEQFKARWKDAGKRPKTINNFLTLARAWYNAGAHLEIYEGENPFSKIKRLVVPKSAVTACTTEERELLLKTAQQQGRDMHLYFALGFFAGLRKDEIGHAAWDWIDWDHHLIRIPADQEWAPKNSKCAQVPLAARLREVLEMYHQGETEGYIIAPDVAEQTARYRYEGREAFARVIQAAAKGQGKKKLKTQVTPHVLRHTFATELLKRGVSIAKVKEWCRHSSIQMTVDLYGHLAGYDDDIDRL